MTSPTIQFDQKTNFTNNPNNPNNPNNLSARSDAASIKSGISGVSRLSRRNSLDAHMRRKVLIAYDNSEFSSKMFDWALGDILRPDVDHVVLATVLDVQESTFIHTHWLRDSSAGRQGHARRVSYSEDEEVKKRLSPLVDRLVAKGMTAQIRLLKGDAKAKLIELAEEVRADLMIVGARGLGPIQRLTMGSVSDYCVHNAECPVLVAKSIDATLARSRGRRGSWHDPEE